MPDIREKSDIEIELGSVAAPDYALADSIVANTPVQLKALLDPIRSDILNLVMDRAATTTELAEALDRPRGTIDHHLKVLASAGLIRVVRSRKVRAMTERYWGRTARTIVYDFGPPVAEGDPVQHKTLFLRTALAETSRVDFAADDDVPGFSTLRHARVPKDRVEDFIKRLDDLSIEFTTTERGGSTVFGMLISVYPTDRPLLAEPDATDTAPERAPKTRGSR